MLDTLRERLDGLETQLKAVQKEAMRDGYISWLESIQINGLKGTIATLRLFVDKKEAEQSETTGSSETTTTTTTTEIHYDAAEKAQEIGAEMLEMNCYQPNYAGPYGYWVPPERRTKLEAGTRVPQEILDKYEGGMITQCNSFAMELAAKVMGDNDPFKDLDKHNANAGKLNSFLNERDDLFEEVETFEKAWEEANKGKLVFLSDRGHIATCVPTKDLMTRQDSSGKTWTFGEVIQAGKTVDQLYLNKAWGTENFKNIEVFVTKNNGEGSQVEVENTAEDPKEENVENTTSSQTQTTSANSQLSASVGAGGVNKKADILLVQQKLNADHSAGLTEDGKIGPATIGAIKNFQQKTFGWADGRIDVGGKTAGKLFGDSSSESSDSSDQGEDTGGGIISDIVEGVTDFFTGGDDDQEDPEPVNGSTWDTKYTDKRIKTLDSRVQGPAFKFVNDAFAQGYKIRVTSALRTVAEQDALYAKGGVTQARGGQSYHNYGLAIDIVEIKDGKALWSNPNWGKIAAIGKACGFEWGGDWTSFVDKPHFQMPFGKSVKDLMAAKLPARYKEIYGVDAPVVEDDDQEDDQDNSSQETGGGSEPPWIRIARKEMSKGFTEGDITVGEHPHISEYFKAAHQGAYDQYKDAKISSSAHWCAAFVTFCMKEAGYPTHGWGGLNVNPWKDWAGNNPGNRPFKGAIAVYKSQHIGFCTKVNNGTVVLLGGNQGSGANGKISEINYGKVGDFTFVAPPGYQIPDEAYF